MYGTRECERLAMDGMNARGRMMPGRPAVWLYGAAALLIFALIFRIASYPVVTSDYTYFVKAWYDALAASPGLSAFVKPFADYAPLYLYLLKLLTFIPVSTLVLAKTLSLAFDLVIAYGAYEIVRRYAPYAGAALAWFAAATFFALPTVMMNSSFWGQSDAIYAAPVVLSVLAMLAGAPLAAAVWFGIGLSVKIQAIFFAPVFLGFLWRRGALLRYVWIPPLVFLLSVIPAWVSGGNLWYWLGIYLHEAGEYPYLSVSAQSIFAFAQPLGLSIAWSTILFWAGILAAAAAAAALIIYMKRINALTPAVLIAVALATTLLMPYLLPRMHERYFYMADLFATLYAFFEPERWVVAVLVVFSSLISYMPFLSGQIGFLSGIHVDLRIPAALLLIPISYVVYDLVILYRASLSTRAPSFGTAARDTLTR